VPVAGPNSPIGRWLDPRLLVACQAKGKRERNMDSKRGLSYSERPFPIARAPRPQRGAHCFLPQSINRA
jgi:hypothetical protein